MFIRYINLVVYKVIRFQLHFLSLNWQKEQAKFQMIFKILKWVITMISRIDPVNHIATIVIPQIPRPFTARPALLPPVTILTATTTVTVTMAPPAAIYV